MLDDLPHEDRRLLLVGDQHHHDVGLVHRIGNRGDRQAVASRLVALCRARPQSNHDVLTGIVQVERLRATLAAVADHRDRLLVECAAIDVTVVIGVHWVLRG